MNAKKNIFKLFACCIPVKGARRSVICDLQRETFRFIPNGLYDILTEYADAPLDKIKAAYDHAYDEIIDQYFAFLEENEFGFWCDDPERFPDLNLAWDRPEAITNAVIDVGVGSDHDYANLFQQLDDLGCKALQVRFYRPASLHEVTDLLEKAKYGRLRSIDLTFPFDSSIDHADLEQLFFTYPRLHGLFIHSAPETARKTIEALSLPIYYRTQVVDSPQCCGEVHAGYFATNIELFKEAQHFNTCLNRKIAIDTYGEIKNCPSMAVSFGNVRNSSLHSALAQRDFKELWSINKDQIDICRDCEFRYICTDCRAFIANPEERYSKPSKCTYDPYTAQWGDPDQQARHKEPPQLYQLPKKQPSAV